MCVKVAYVNFNNKWRYDDDDDTFPAIVRHTTSTTNMLYGTYVQIWVSEQSFTSHLKHTGNISFKKRVLSQQLTAMALATNAYNDHEKIHKNKKN